MPQSAPNLSQMEPKTLPNPLFRPFCAPFFPTWKLHWFFIDFWLIFVCFSRGRPLQNTVKTKVFSMFLQNRNFSKNTRNLIEIVPKSFPNPSQNFPKSMKNRKNRWKKLTWLKIPLKFEKIAQTCEKVRKMSPRPSQKEVNHFVWRSPRTPLWPLLIALKSY